MKIVKDLIDSIEKEEQLLKVYEQKTDIDNCKSIITNIIAKLDSEIRFNSLPEDEIKILITLKKTYLNKLQNYSYYTTLSHKEQIIQKNLKEKYLNNKGKNNSFIDYQDNTAIPNDYNKEGNIKLNHSNKMIGKDFEVVNPDQIILTEICNTCDNLLKRFEEEFIINALPKDEFVNNIKTMESFYVFEVKKDCEGDRKMVINYIESITQIKEKCELLKASRIKDDIKAVIKLEEEIKTINDEIAKINARNQFQLNHIKRNKMKSNTLPSNSNIN